MANINENLIRSLYKKYSPNEDVDSKLEYIQKTYGEDQDLFVKSFYKKYAPSEDVDSKLEYIKSSYPTSGSVKKGGLVKEGKGKIGESVPKSTEDSFLGEVSEEKKKGISKYADKLTNLANFKPSEEAIKGIRNAAETPTKEYEDGSASYPWQKYSIESRKSLQAKNKGLAKDKQIPITQEAIKEEALNKFVESKIKGLKEQKSQEVLEDFETDFGVDRTGSVGDFINYVAGGSSYLGEAFDLGDQKNEINYIKNKKELHKQIGIKQAELEKPYRDAVGKIVITKNALEKDIKELNETESRFKSMKEKGEAISNEEYEVYKNLHNNVKQKSVLFDAEVEKLGENPIPSDDFETIKNLTLKTYDNLEMVGNNVGSSIINLFSGVAQLGHEMQIPVILDKWGLADVDPKLMESFDGVQEVINSGFELGNSIKDQNAPVPSITEVSSLSDFGMYMMDLGSGQLVNTALTVALPPAGLAILAAQATGGKMHDMNMEMAGEKWSDLELSQMAEQGVTPESEYKVPPKEINAGQYYTTAAIYGGAEYLTEKVSLGILKGGFKNAKKAFELAGKDGVSTTLRSVTTPKQFAKLGYNIGKDSFNEAGAEGIVTLSSNFADRFVLGNEDVSLLDGMTDAMAAGFFMGNMFSAPPAVTAGVAQAFSSEGEHALANKLNKEMISLSEQRDAILAKDPSDKNGVASMLQGQIETTLDKQMESMNKVRQRTLDMTGADRQGMIDQYNYEHKLRAEIDKVNEMPDAELNKESKAILIDSMAQEIADSENTRARILGDATFNADIKRQSDLSMQIRAENNTLDEVEYVVADGPKEALQQGIDRIDALDLNSDQKSALKADLTETFDNITAASPNGKGYNGLAWGDNIKIKNKEGKTETLNIPMTFALNKKNATVASHELGHQTVYKQFIKNNPDAVGLVDDLEAYVKKNYKKAYEVFQNVRDTYESEGYSKEQMAEEQLANLGDFIRMNDIKADATLRNKLLGGFRKVNDGNNQIETGADVFDMLVSYNQSFDTGQLQGLAKAVIKGDAKVKAKEQAETTTAKDEKSKTAFSKDVNPKQVQTMVDKVANRAWSKFGKPIPANVKQKAGVTRQSYIESAKTELQQIAKEFDPKKTDKDGNPIDFNRFMANRGMQRMNSLASRLGVESAEKPTSKRLGQAVKEGEKEFDIKSEDATPEEAMISKEVGTETRKGIKLAERLGDDAKKISDKVKKMKPVLEGKTYKTLKDLAPDDTQRMFGIKPKPGNLTKDDVRNAQAFIRKNADILLAMLPEGTTISGKATGLQKVLLDPFYTKGRRVKAAKTGSTQGLATQNKKPNIKASEFLEVFGITPAGQPNVSDRNTSARIKALVDQTGKLLTNQAVREAMPDAPVEITEGKSRVMFSKNIEATKKAELEKIKKNNAKEKKSGTEVLDSLVDAEALAELRADPKVLEQAIEEIGELAGKKLGSFGVDKFLMPGGYTSGSNLPSLDKYGFKVVSDQSKIEDPKLRKEAQKRIEEGTLIDLKTIKDKIKEKTKVLPKEKVKAFQIAAGAKSGVAAEKHAKNRDLHNKGVKQTIDVLLDTYLNTSKGEALVRQLFHHGKLNKNLNRNLALPVSVEDGARVNGKRRTDTTDEHQFQAIENAEALLGFFKNIKQAKNPKVAKKALELYEKWMEKNYTQFLLKNESDIIKGDLTNKKGEVWIKSGSNSHPIIKDKLKKFIEIAGKKDATIEQVEKAFNEIASADLRYFSDFGYLNPNTIRTYQADGSSITKAQEYNVVVPKQYELNPDVALAQGKIIESVILTEAGVLTGDKAVTRSKAQEIMDIALPIALSKNKTNQKVNVPVVKSAKVMDTQYSKDLTSEDVIKKATSLDAALSNARNPNAPVKKIRVFDFDDTLARTKSNVLYTMPDGTTGKLTAEEFAKRGDSILEQGGEFDFSEFNKVIDGKKGPLFEVAQKIQEARGADDIFVLTARSQEASPAIKEFLDAIGLNIPAQNISGLGNSSPFAKSNWIVDKAAEGYNDFYFADDATQNVKAVRDALEVLDVKSKTQQAKIKFSKDLNMEFNEIIEQSKGIDKFKVYSDVKAQLAGARKGRGKFFIPPSAEDFQGLLYAMLGKGKQGTEQMKFFDEALNKPYARAMENLATDRVNLMADFKALKKQLEVPKDLRKKTKSGFTNEQAVRVYLWAKTGQEIPGLSKKDFKELNDIVENNPKLKVFADQMLSITKGDGYSTPKAAWQLGTITTDLIDVLNTNKRSKYLQEWQANVDTIFSKDNMNKLEAALGPKYVEALRNSLSRMKAGRNRIAGGNRLSNQVLNYINQSTGVTMFFNARSALLQTISAANFINWSFNNPLNAGKAFANQPQYWKDFTMLMNSDYLVDRRNGLKLNINESEIADAAKTSTNKAKAVLNYILEKGYIPTKYADSFAIASGGAMFYRNRVNNLIKKGMSIADAEAQAMEEFKATSEVSQQSSDPSKISQQQSGDMGRIILQYVNTPMQYARVQKRDMQDIINRRPMPGKTLAQSNRTRLSRITYYAFLQNMLFNALQQGLFAMGFGDDDEEMSESDEKRIFNTANGMMDSWLRGLGFAGVTVQVLKNLGINIYDRSQRDRPEYSDAWQKLLEFSPAIKSKLSKLRSAGYPFDSKKRRQEVFDKGFSLDNPAYESLAKVITATTNIPLDRLFSKINNIKGALEDDQEAWKSVAMLLGWPEWQLEDKEDSKPKTPEEKAVVKEDKKEARYKAAVGSTDYDTIKDLTAPQQIKLMKSLGIDSDTIKKAKSEDAKIKLIIKKHSGEEPTEEEKKEIAKQKKFDEYKALTKKDQVEKLLELGLTKAQIRALKYEKDRVNKLIELEE